MNFLIFLKKNQGKSEEEDGKKKWKLKNQKKGKIKKNKNPLEEEGKMRRKLMTKKKRKEKRPRKH